MQLLEARILKDGNWQTGKCFKGRQFLKSPDGHCIHQ